MPFAVVQALSSIAKKVDRMPVQFKTYSVYPNEKPFLCIDMAVTHTVLDLQAEIRSKCDQYAKLYHINYFDQGI